MTPRRTAAAAICRQKFKGATTTSGSGKNEDRELVRWGNPPTGINNSPLYLAVERKAFGSPRVRVEIEDNLTGADYTKALIAGKFDMGHIGSPVLFAALKRTTRYAVVGLGLIRRPCFYVVAPPNIDSVQDLRGKVIGLNKLGTCLESTLRTLLSSHGVAAHEVRLRPYVEGWRIIEAILKSKVDAAVLWEPYVSYLERAYRCRSLAMGQWGTWGYCLYARRDLLASEPELVWQMVSQYSEAVRYALAHVDQAARTLYGRYGKNPGVTPADISHAIRRNAQHWTAETTIDKEFLGVIIEELKEQRILPHQFSLAPVLEFPR